MNLFRAFRPWWRSALVAVACAGLGTGGAIFVLSVANGVLFTAPPFEDADRLARIWSVADGSTDFRDLSYLDARDIEARSLSFDAVELTVRTRLAATIGAVTERLRGESVTPGYLDLVRTSPALGRPFAPDEYAEDANPVVIISHALWQRSFGGDPAVIGRTILARSSFGRDQDRSLEVIGVMPPGFIGTVDPDVSDFWIPVQQYMPRIVLERRVSRGTWVLARLRAGVPIAAADAELRDIGAQLAREYPADYPGISFVMESVGESFRSRYRDGVVLLGGVAAFLLLIACTNVTHLLLARLAQRNTEFRVRTALGASRESLVRMVLSDAIVIAAVGGAVGIIGAGVALRVVSAGGSFALPPYVSVGMDARVAAFAVLVVGITAVLSGALPAWLGGRKAGTASLRDEGRSGTMSRRQGRGVRAIVAAEIAFSFVLLAGSGLMVRSYANLLGTDPGYRTDGLLRLALSLDATVYRDADAILRFATDVRDDLEQHPAVEGASVIEGTLPPWIDTELALGVRGEPVPSLSGTAYHPVDPAFLDVMDIALLAGRGILAADEAGGPRVAVVSASVARTLRGGDGREAIGETIEVGIGPRGSPAGTPVTIVGIVEDVKYEGPMGLRSRDLDVYVPLAQAPGQVLSIAVHTRVDGARARAELVRLVSARAPTSPMHWLSTMEEELGLQYRDARLYAMMTGLFGSGAIILVLLGVYGVIANAVMRRSSELSIRMAVGATPSHVSLLVVRQVLGPALVGIAAGGLVALAASRLARTLVHGMDTTDPLTFLAVAGLLVAATLLAVLGPARRAARVQPAAALGAN